MSKILDGQGLKVLVIDDEAKSRDILADILNFQGFDVLLASNGPDAMDTIDREELDCVLCDVRLPGCSGLEVLRHALCRAPITPVVMISGYGTIQMAVEATKEGAFDFLEKPLEAERVLVTLRNALAQRRLQLEKIETSRDTLARYGMVGSSPAMQTLYRQIEKIAPSECRVIIRGETGTGKELVARALHGLSRRAEGPFVAVNCAAIPRELIESQLFGHRKGAFTGAADHHAGKFAEAHGGTLFLDEIAELSPEAQAKVLRAIELGEIEPVGGTATRVNVRLIAATQKALQELVEVQTFREDLYHRLNVVELVTPPLRDRDEDIGLLAQHFFTHYTKIHARPDLTRLNAQVLRLLGHQSWPGNIRELQHTIERMVLFARGPEITVADVYAALETAHPITSPHVDFTQTDLTYQEAREAFEKAFLRNVLAQHDGSISAAAKALQMDRTNLWRKVKRYGLTAE